MYKISFHKARLFFFVLLSVYVYFFSVYNLTYAADDNGANIVFAEDQFNFGQIADHTKVSHTFTFENKGRSPLVISNVKSSCGCTAAVLGKKMYEPGEIGQLEVSFNAGSRQGPFSKNIQIYSNDVMHPQITIKISGEIANDLSVSPHSIQFGLVSNPKDESRVLMIRAKNQELLNHLKIETSEGISAVLNPPIQKQEKNVEIRLKENIKLGYLNGNIAISIPGKDLIHVKVNGFIEGPFQINPKTVILNVYRDGNKRSMGKENSISEPDISTEVLIENKGPQDYQITKIEYDQDIFTITNNREIFENHRSRFRLRIILKGDQHVSTNRVLRVFTNTPDSSVIEIPIKVWVR